ncbi:hypothetical protein ACFLU7_00095, partial [Chloroflexota bacterium]
RIDAMAIVKDYWSRIGVDLDLNIKEYGVFLSTTQARKHEEMSLYISGQDRPARQLYTIPGAPANQAQVDDPYLNERRGNAFTFEYMAKDMQDARNQLIKEATLRMLEQVYMIGLPVSEVYTMWQPWVQNYRGEYCAGLYSYYTFTKYLWIDQNIKKEMTGK